MKRLVNAFLHSCLLALISLFSVSLLWTNPVLLTEILAVTSILMLSVWRSREDLFLFILCGVFGALAEITAIVFGAWKYASPSIFGIPYWLPLVWGLAGIFIKRISFEVHDFYRDVRHGKKSF